MNAWRDSRWGLALAVVGLWGLASSALAQDATPAAGGQEESARIVAASECQVEPRPAAEITQLLQLDGEGLGAPPGVAITAPIGQIVDTKTALAIKEATRAVIACFNTQNLAQITAMMTDDGVQRTLWGLSASAPAREATKTRLAGTPQPRQPEALIRLIAVTDVSRLPDGRMAAFAVINDPVRPPIGPETLLFVFAPQGNEWLLDNLVNFVIVPPVSNATPAP